MGLRERHAVQTRELILDTALPLFLDRGYEATTMEQIAEAAQIGTSTLYRYFPTKDALVVEPIALRGQMAAELRSRPADEDLELALGHAVSALLASPRAHPRRLRQIMAVLEREPAPRARMQEEFVAERTLLEQAVAERLGRPAGDLFCVMTARLATDVLELVGDLRRLAGDETATTAAGATAYAREVLGRLHREPPVLPRFAD